MSGVTRAMLLAAGRGERLRPLTDRHPKPLIPLGGEPMVFRVLALLAAAGIREVHVNTHHLGEQIPAALGDGSRWGLRLTYHPEEVVLGTGGGLANAIRNRPELASGPLLMINSDILVDVDLSAVIARHADGNAAATLVLRPDPEAARYGIIATDEAGRIRRFLHLDTGNATRDYMFTGIQVLSPRCLTFLEPAGSVFPITDSYLKALQAGEHLEAFVHHGYWSDLGTPERLLQAEADLAAGRIGRLPPPHPHPHPRPRPRPRPHP